MSEETNRVSGGEADGTGVADLPPMSEIDWNGLEEADEDYYNSPNRSWDHLKWMADGAKTIDDLIERLQGRVYHFVALREQGWQLEDVIDEGHVRLVRDPLLADAGSYHLAGGVTCCGGVTTVNLARALNAESQPEVAQLVLNPADAAQLLGMLARSEG